MSRLHTKIVPLALATLPLLALAGCQAFATQKQGGRMASLDQHTYVSEAFLPKTVRLVDVRTQEELWSVDVPVDRKLVVRFYTDKSKDNPEMPDIMRWEITSGDNWGTLLDNQMPVPAKDARRLEWELRTGPEYVPEENGAPLDIMPAGAVQSSAVRN